MRSRIYCCDPRDQVLHRFPSKKRVPDVWDLPDRAGGSAVGTDRHGETLEIPPLPLGQVEKITYLFLTFDCL